MKCTSGVPGMVVFEAWVCHGNIRVRYIESYERLRQITEGKGVVLEIQPKFDQVSVSVPKEKGQKAIAWKPGVKVDLFVRH